MVLMSLQLSISVSAVVLASGEKKCLELLFQAWKNHVTLEIYFKDLSQKQSLRNHHDSDN